MIHTVLYAWDDFLNNWESIGNMDFRDYPVIPNENEKIVINLSNGTVYHGIIAKREFHYHFEKGVNPHVEIKLFVEDD
jgi:hypothetical protein